MFDLVEKGTNILQMFAPIAVLALAIVTAWGVIKWGKRLLQAFMELASSPGSFIFALVIIALFLYTYFRYIEPLFNQL